VGEKNWANIRVIKAILILFQLVLGLKVNWYKSMLLGVNVNDYWLIDVAVMINYKIDCILFVYLCHPFGGILPLMLCGYI
jgi:hypothetical protein